MLDSTQGGQQEAAVVTSAGTDPAQRVFQIGDHIDVRSPDDYGRWKPPVRFELASADNLRSSPPQIGPKNPIHKAVIGQPNDVGKVRVNLEIKVELAS